jgi:hypothetical protein
MDLEKRWNGTARALPALEGGVGSESGHGVGGGNVLRVDDVTAGENPGAGAGGRLSQGGGAGDIWEPRVMHISGHTDRY